MELNIQLGSNETSDILSNINYQNTIDRRRENYLRFNKSLQGTNKLQLHLEENATPMIYPYLLLHNSNLLIDRLKRSLGLNCFPAQNNSLELNGSSIFDLIYPIGSIYLSVNNVNPGTIFGGTWEQIKDRFLLSAGETYSSGSIGGEANHTLSISETPSHTHTRGTMNITGSREWAAGGYGKANSESFGAFYNTGYYQDTGDNGYQKGDGGTLLNLSIFKL